LVRRVKVERDVGRVLDAGRGDDLPDAAVVVRGGRAGVDLVIVEQRIRSVSRFTGGKARTRIDGELIDPLRRRTNVEVIAEGERGRHEDEYGNQFSQVGELTTDDQQLFPSSPRT